MDLSSKLREYRNPLLIAITGALLLVLLFALTLNSLIDWQVQAALRNNAQIRAQHWADNFFKTTPSARRMVETGIITPSERDRIESSFPLIDVVRFKLFNREGMQTLLSDSGLLGPSDLFSDEALQVFKSGEPIVGLHEHEEADEYDHEAHLETYVDVYLPAVLPSGERIGALEVYVDVSEFEEALEKVFQRVSGYLILGTFIALLFPAAADVYRTRQVMKQDKRLLELTRYDQLTGVLNRNSISDYLKSHFEADTASPTLGILFIDVDQFKQVNDEHGHASGDAILKHFADQFRSSTRSNDDIVGRYGGDEFIVLCRGITLKGFRKLYGRIMEATKAPFSFDNTVHHPTLSIGAYLAGVEDDEKTSLHRADLALYAAKRQGRNQVVEYSEDLEGLFDREETQETA
ncbi:MAG: GGDEF domain-containing protein [Roseibium sp.]|uniref:GGDEF domain-containing protein n=3 Tax=Roseibium sp. TaxID=1936156 RepID=UPI001B18A23F|nr:GGDEF domain-containing protein [Roseibium sp.]MBO6891351.1 GGDEF domain-containing protein [Roseibium sp.]